MRALTSPVHRWILIAFFLSRDFKVSWLTTAYFPGRVDILLTHFSNPGNRNALGKCCDGNKSCNACTDACDTYFTACILHKQPTYPSTNHSQIIFSNSTFNWDVNLLKHQPNPANLVTIFEPVVWKDVPFRISLYDDDTPPGRTFNASRRLSELIFQYNTKLSANPNQNWTEQNYTNNGTTLKFLYRLKCHPNDYGKICERTCAPHKICLSNGSETCRDGYTGSECRTVVCKPSCKNHGTCVSPGKCRCLNGWTGPLCSQCVPNAKCRHGTCSKIPGRCHCDSGWTGQYCSALSNYCGLFKPCQNSGMCVNNVTVNYTCSCMNGFRGKNCETFHCPPTCNLSRANCTSAVGCSCHDGWSGSDCNQCVKRAGCVNGYCVKPNECDCHRGWIGEFCNINASQQFDCNGHTSCRNNGTCKRWANGTTYCVCKTGFYGKYCEHVAPCSVSCNQSHGSCQGNKCSCYSGWQGDDCNECVKLPHCVNGYCTTSFDCRCSRGWTGKLCDKKVECSFSCNKERGFCDEISKTCKCSSGWKGPECSQCIKNRTCVNGYCTKPFECLCDEGWYGDTCNISSCEDSRNQNKSCEKPRLLLDTAKDKGMKYYVVLGVSVPLFVCLVFLVLFLIWRHCRRRAQFCVTTPEVFSNNNTVKQSYCSHGDDRIISTRNNNYSTMQDFATISPSDIVINKMLSTQHLPLHSMSHQNGKISNDNKTLNRSDSGFIEEGL